MSARLRTLAAVPVGLVMAAGLLAGCNNGTAASSSPSETMMSEDPMSASPSPSDAMMSEDSMSASPSPSDAMMDESHDATMSPGTGG